MSETDMVEHVARAMGEADKWDRVDNSPDYRSHLPGWVEYADLARAAIEAMADPTDAMVEAGVRADFGKTLGDRVTNSHRAMIKAALPAIGYRE